MKWPQKTKESQIKNPEIINSLIGEDTEFIGNFRLAGDLRIDGIFRGNIRTEGRVILGETGMIYGNIWADEVIVGGEIHGTIICNSKITALPSGKIQGNTASSKLVLEKGTRFNGYCKVNPSLFKDAYTQNERIKEILKEFALENKDFQLSIVPHDQFLNEKQTMLHNQDKQVSEHTKKA